MNLVDITRNMMLEDYDYYDDDDDWSYTPSEEEIKSEKTKRAKRLFPMEYKTTEKEEINVDNWDLKDCVEESEKLANKYKTILLNEYNLTINDLQRASYSNTDKSIMDIIVCWKRWNNFILSFKRYV